MRGQAQERHREGKPTLSAVALNWPHDRMQKTSVTAPKSTARARLCRKVDTNMNAVNTAQSARKAARPSLISAVCVRVCAVSQGIVVGRCEVKVWSSDKRVQVRAPMPQEERRRRIDWSNHMMARACLCTATKTKSRERVFITQCTQ